MPYIGKKPADIIATAVDTTTGTFSGVVDADAGITVDNITIDGTEIDLSSGDLTLDVAGDIILDADGGDIKLKDGSTIFGELTNNASADGNLDIKCPVSDADIRFKGNDGGATITALALDMSSAGSATVNHDIKLPDNGIAYFGAGFDLAISSDGTNGTIAAPNGTLTLDVAGDIILDADGGDITLKDGGTGIGVIGNSGGATFYGGTASGIMFNGVNINPTNGTATRADNANDIGAASYRFKDLYLSGGVLLGGTGTANKLDDYEEGSFDIAMADGTSHSLTQNASYTKIGRFVHFQAKVVFPDTGTDTTATKLSLPFTVRNRTNYFPSSVVSSNGFANAQIAVGLQNTATFLLQNINGSTGATNQHLTSANLNISLHYET